MTEHMTSADVDRALKFAADCGPKEQPNGSFYTPDALLQVATGEWCEMSRATQLDVIAWEVLRAGD